MIEEYARVVAIDEGCVWVETQRQSTCGACGIKPGCGTATLAKVLGQRHAPVRVLSTLSVDIGDQVIIGIAEQALLQGSAAVYLTPLLTMFLGAVLGHWMLSPPSEALSVVAGLLGLAGGLLWLRAFSRKIRTDSRFQPIVLRRLA